ncbi:MAG TPA: hypothetical protein VFR73_19530 [Hyphomicrobiaceae bacterium]|nr:hypothetical protein [Hyphomicrobiaceae bacterium]
MQLAPLRFTKIEGTTVAVNVASAAEAKAALKELRHKKRELKFVRGALAKQYKAAKAKRPRKGKAEPSGVATFLDDVRWGFGKMLDGKPEPKPPARPPTLAEIEHEMRSIDEIMHNIDGCILQLQGKLLAHE